MSQTTFHAPLVGFPISDQDQNFDRATWARSDVSTTTCIIPGGKYVATGPAGFRVLSAKELEG